MRDTNQKMRAQLQPYISQIAVALSVLLLIGVAPVTDWLYPSQD